MAITFGPKLGLMNNAAIGETYYDQFRQFLQALDQLVQGSVISNSVTVPPTTPSNGDAYLLTTATPSGAWSGMLGKIAVWDTQVTNAGTDTTVPQWVFYTPQPGWILWVISTAAVSVYNGTTWQSVPSGTVPVVTGGTGATTATSARSNLGAAASGANTDITSLSGIGQISAASGGSINLYLPGAGPNSLELVINGTGSLYQAMLGFVTYSTQTTVGATGGASALPATPRGYIPVSINGLTYVIPFYAVS